MRARREQNLTIARHSDLDGLDGVCHSGQLFPRQNLENVESDFKRKLALARVVPGLRHKPTEQTVAGEQFSRGGRDAGRADEELYGRNGSVRVSLTSKHPCEKRCSLTLRTALRMDGSARVDEKSDARSSKT